MKRWLPLLALTALPVARGDGETADLRRTIADAVDAVREATAPVPAPDAVAVTVVDLRGATPQRADYRGDERFYPASVIKLFFLAYAHRGLEDGTLANTAELRRGLHDMIVDSSNDATSLVVDSLTGTTSGPELPAADLAAWSERRSVVTRYFRSLGYGNVNAQRKPWGDGPYGREKQDMEVHPPARNFLSTNDTARLLEEIAAGRCVTPARSAEMLGLMARDPFAAAGDPDSQAKGFSGAGLDPGMKLWSKAGWTSQVRHDAALIELPGGSRVIIVTFTAGPELATNRVFIPAVVRRILKVLPPVSR